MTDLLTRLEERQKLPPRWERRAIREAVNVSTQAVGQAVGVTRGTIARWETQDDPSDEHLTKYLQTLDILKGFAR